MATGNTDRFAGHWHYQLCQPVQRMVLGVLVPGFCGIGAGMAFWMYAKFVRDVSIRAWIMLSLPLVALVVLLAITHEVLRWAGREEGQVARGS